MANVTETARWETGVYQIEKSDKVLGGAEGKVNVQAQQLANRTAYLKQQVESKANKTDLTNGLNGKANSSHNHTMSQITDLAAAMNAKANLISPTFSGAPKAPTPAQTVNDTTIATTAFVKAAIAALVGSAPEALDTLEELSNALANDANLKQTLLTEIGKKAPLNHNHNWDNINNKPATATRWPNSTEQGFTQSLGENGWVKLPNGLILQWGQLTVHYESVKDYLFNLAFPQRCCAVLVSNSVNSGILATLGTLRNNGRELNSLGNSDYIQGLNAYPLDKTKMRLWNDQNIGQVDKSVNWFAIGF